MNPIASPSKQRSTVSYLLSGVLGGLVVLVLGSVLIATDVIDTGDTKEVTTPAPLTRSVVNDGGSDSGSSEGRTVADIYKQEGRGVVFVESRGVSEGDSIFGTPQQGTATGSGFLVDRQGTILTNAHVVEGADSVSIRLEQNGGESIPAEVKGRDTSSDLAVLKVDPDDVKDVDPLPLGDSSKAQVGDPVVAIGNPFGFTRTVTTGIVSALQRQIDAPNGFPIRNVIQTDASINPGNSGGPLLDADGRVIGINSQIATGGGQGSVGIGFAIPINTAKNLLPQLKEGGEIKRAYLGITMAPVTKEIAQDLNLPVESGALIQDVVKGGPADDAGLRGGRTQTSDGLKIGGDVLVKVDGKTIKTPDDVANAIADNKPGDKIELEYYRGDNKKSASIELDKRPNAAPTGQSEDGGGLLPLP
jgi:S1-C subfamily serine protease